MIVEEPIFETSDYDYWNVDKTDHQDSGMLHPRRIIDQLVDERKLKLLLADVFETWQGE